MKLRSSIRLDSARAAVWALVALSALVPGLGAWGAAAAPQVPALQSVVFATPREGFAGGPRLIVRTENGGLSWEVAYRGSVDVREFTFANAHSGLAVGVDAVLRTADGGRTWLPAGEPGGRSSCSPHSPCILSADLVTPELGFAVEAPAMSLGTSPEAVTAVGDRLFVANQSGTLNALQDATGHILGSLPFSALADAVVPSAGTLAVATGGGVDFVDPGGLHVVRRVLAGSFLCGLASAGGRLFAADMDGDVHALTAQGAVLWRAHAPSLSCSLAASPGGRLVYVSDDIADAVDVLDGSTGRARQPLFVPDPGTIALSPDGTRLYVSEGEAEIAELDAKTGRLLQESTIGTPTGLLLGPAGRVLYAALGGARNRLAALDANTLRVLWTLPLAAAPQGLALSPDARLLYAALPQDDAVARVNIASHAAARLLASGGTEVLDRFNPQLPAHDGKLLRTVDGGRGWTVQATPTPVQSVCMANAADGFAAGADTVLRTSDGGRAWRKVFAAPLHTGVTWFADVRCGSPRVAWVEFIGADAGLCNKAFIVYRTSDAGLHWAAVAEEQYMTDYPTSQAVSDPGSYPGPLAVFGTGGALIAASACGSRLTPAETSDGGRVWLPSTTVLAPYAVSAAFSDARTAWLVPGGLNRPELLESSQGAAWQSIRPLP